MERANLIAKALNELGSSNLSSDDRAALTDFVEDYFFPQKTHTVSMNGKINKQSIHEYN